MFGGITKGFWASAEVLNQRELPWSRTPGVSPDLLVRVIKLNPVGPFLPPFCGYKVRPKRADNPAGEGQLLQPSFFPVGERFLLHVLQFFARQRAGPRGSVPAGKALLLQRHCYKELRLHD